MQLSILPDSAVNVSNKVFFSYVIHDLSSESHYLVSVNVSICYEPNNCSLSEVILKDVMFPKAVCNFKSTDFKLPGTQMIAVGQYKLFN